MALADLATLEVEADVAEANVAKVGNGQPAEVTVEAIPDRRYEAVLRQVIPTADRTKATVMVKVTILDKDEDLKPEMSAKVTFLEPEKETARTPRRRRRRWCWCPARRWSRATADRSSSWCARARSRSARWSWARRARAQVIVEEGLAGGETLVVRPPEGLADGDAVRIKA